MNTREKLIELVDKQTAPKFFQVYNATVDPYHRVYRMDQFDERFENWKPSQVVAKLSDYFNIKDRYFCVWERSDKIVSFTNTDSTEYPVGDEEWENMFNVLLASKPKTGVKAVDNFLAKI